MDVRIILNGLKWSVRKADHSTPPLSPPPVPRLRILGAILPFPHITPWCARGLEECSHEDYTYKHKCMYCTCVDACVLNRGTDASKTNVTSALRKAEN